MTQDNFATKRQVILHKKDSFNAPDIGVGETVSRVASVENSLLCLLWVCFAKAIFWNSSLLCTSVVNESKRLASSAYLANDWFSLMAHIRHSFLNICPCAHFIFTRRPGIFIMQKQLAFSTEWFINERSWRETFKAIKNIILRNHKFLCVLLWLYEWLNRGFPRIKELDEIASKSKHSPIVTTYHRTTYSCCILSRSVIILAIYDSIYLFCCQKRPSE